MKCHFQLSENVSWAVWCFWHIAVHYFIDYEKKRNSMYQQITQQYLRVFQSGYIHCKVQTLSFQMTSTLC